MACKTQIGAWVISPYSHTKLAQLATDDPSEVISVLMADPAKPEDVTFSYDGNCRVTSSDLSLTKIVIDGRNLITFVDNDADAGAFCSAGVIAYPVVGTFPSGVFNNTTATIYKLFNSEAEFIAYLNTFDVSATKVDGECYFETFDIANDIDIELTTMEFVYDLCCAFETEQRVTSIISGLPYVATNSCWMPILSLSNPFGTIDLTGLVSASDIITHLNTSDYGGADKLWELRDDCKFVLKQAPNLAVPADMESTLYKRWKIKVTYYFANSGGGLTSWKDSKVKAHQTPFDHFGTVKSGSNVHWYNGMYYSDDDYGLGSNAGSLWQNNGIEDMFRNVYAKGDTGVADYDNRGINNIGGFKAETLEAWEFWKQQLVEHCMANLQALGICGSVGIEDDITFKNTNGGATTRHYAYLYYDIPPNYEMQDTSWNDFSAIDYTGAPSANCEWGFNVGNPAEPDVALTGWVRSDILLHHTLGDFVQDGTIGAMVVSPSSILSAGSTNFQEDCSHPPLNPPTNEDTTYTEVVEGE